MLLMPVQRLEALDTTHACASATQVFVSTSSTRRINRHLTGSQSMQMLRQLPSDLAHAVFKTADASLLRLLHVLPASLHALAISARTSRSDAGDALTLSSRKDLPPSATSAALDAFTLHAAQCTGLTSLTMRSTRSGGAIAAALVRMAPLLQQLSALELSDNGMGPAASATLISALPRLPCLVQLRLAGNRMGDAGAQALIRLPVSSGPLTKLDIASNQISKVPSEFLHALMQRFTALRDLVLSDNPLDLGLEQPGDMRRAERQRVPLRSLCFKLGQLSVDAGTRQPCFACFTFVFAALTLLQLNNGVHAKPVRWQDVAVASNCASCALTACCGYSTARRTAVLSCSQS
jgi:Leucine Rich repeat